MRNTGRLVLLFTILFSFNSFSGEITGGDSRYNIKINDQTLLTEITSRSNNQTITAYSSRKSSVTHAAVYTVLISRNSNIGTIYNISVRYSKIVNIEKITTFWD